MDTSVLDKAIVFAVKAHAGTGRRGKGLPLHCPPDGGCGNCSDHDG